MKTLQSVKKWGIASFVIASLGLAATTYSFRHDIKQKTKPSTTTEISAASIKDPTFDPYKIDFKNLDQPPNQAPTDSLCNINDEFSCDKVAQDKWSTIFGIPTGFYGFSYFVAAIVLLILIFARPSLSSYFAHTHLVMNLIAFVVSMTLLLYSKYGLGVFCPSCIAIDTVVSLQLLCAIIFHKAVLRWTSLRHFIWEIFCGGALATTVVIVVLGAYYLFGPRLT